MLDVAETALVYSDSTEVPTSLWVEARIIYAKQMIFMRDVESAVGILREICYILPPFEVAGLSFVDRELESLEQMQHEAGDDSTPLVPTYSKKVTNAIVDDIVLNKAMKREGGDFKEKTEKLQSALSEREAEIQRRGGDAFNLLFSATRESTASISSSRSPMKGSNVRGSTQFR